MAQTGYQEELTAAEHLLRQGFVAFTPTFVQRHSLKPLFQGYVFIFFDIANSRWRSVNGTRGVKQLLWGESPSPLPVGVGERLHSANPLSDPDSVMASMLVGCRVRVDEGLWTGQNGEVSSSVGSRVRVLLNLLGGNVEIDLHARDVTPA